MKETPTALQQDVIIRAIILKWLRALYYVKKEIGVGGPLGTIAQNLISWSGINTERLPDQAEDLEKYLSHIAKADNDTLKMLLEYLLNKLLNKEGEMDRLVEFKGGRLPPYYEKLELPLVGKVGHFVWDCLNSYSAYVTLPPYGEMYDDPEYYPIIEDTPEEEVGLFDVLAAFRILYPYRKVEDFNINSIYSIVNFRERESNMAHRIISDFDWELPRLPGVTIGEV